MKNTNNKSYLAGIYKIILLQDVVNDVSAIDTNDLGVLVLDNINASLKIKAIAVDNQISVSQSGIRGEIEDSRKLRKMKSPFRGLPQNLDGYEYLIEFKWTNLEDNIIQLIKNYRFKEVNQLMIYSQSGILFNIVARPHIRWNWVIPFKPETVNSKDGVEKTSIHLNFSIHFFCPDQQINFLENNN